MKKSKLLLIATLGLISLPIGLLVFSCDAFAETNTGSQALEISPPVVSLSANPGQSVEAKIVLRNISNNSLFVTGVLNDFTASGEDGTPKILLDEGESSPYSFKEWTNPLQEMTLAARKTQDLKITINVPTNAAPGGYYGIIRFTATPPELKGTGVSLSASLGALVLLKVNGVAKEEMTIKSFSASSDGKDGWLFESAPIKFAVRMSNTGNIHEQPVGQIAITDMFGKKIANVNVNMPIRNVLPQSVRKFEPLLDSSVIGNRILFGYYKADLKMKYGTDGTILTDSISFWIIPYKLIAISITGIIAAFFVLKFMIKRYNRHIISKARGQHRRK